MTGNESVHDRRSTTRTLTAPLALPASRAVLALGGDITGVVSRMVGDQIQTTDAFGDLADSAAYRRFSAAVADIIRDADPSELTIAHDMHPGFMSTALAQRQRCNRIPIQHHHAHIASCLAENSHTGPVIGVVCDGTGYGTDRTIWGCEILVCDLAKFERAAHLQCFDLPGGDVAACETWRPALSLIRGIYGNGWRATAGCLFENVPGERLGTVERMLSRRVNCSPTSSLGRLFDAVAFLLGLCDYNHTEAQAPIALEQSAATGHSGRALPFDVMLPANDEGCEAVIDVRPALRSLVDRRREGRHVPDLAADFHETVVAMLAAGVELVSDRVRLGTVAISGGCFFNRLLSDGLAARLERRDMSVLRHHRVSMGDAGLSVGQAVIAAARCGGATVEPRS